MTSVPTVPLTTPTGSVPIPQLGFGVWQVPEEEVTRAVGSALEVGYRHIDTAAMYGNERGVGDAVKQSGLDDNVWITTKLNNDAHGFDAATKAFEASMDKLQRDVLDLYLIHWPLPMVGKYVDTWRAFVELRDQRKVRSIGVSNFTPAQIEEVTEATGVAPVVNQIEVHPEFSQAGLRAWHDAHAIVTESYSPLGPDTAVLDNPGIAEVAAALGRTPAQVILRWHVQLGAIPIPKSADPARLRQNLAVFDFELDAGQMAVLDGANRDNRTGGDPETNLEL
jgi:diketogulonate reductase-like aldo/keto reductase